MEQKISFELLCNYAKEKGYTARTEPNKAKDYTQHYFCMYGQIYMALYQGERRTLRGHDKPEVCWVCIDCNGKLYSVPSRQIRNSPTICGFGLTDRAKAEIKQYMGITRKCEELNKLLQEAE